MSTNLLSNISAISLDLPLRVPIYNAYSESPHLQSTLISRRCSHQMTLWLGLYLTPVLPFAVSSLWKIQIPFIQFGLSIVFVISKIKMWQNFVSKCPSWNQPNMTMINCILIQRSSLGYWQPRTIHVPIILLQVSN